MTTIQDVASRAGVAAITVSRALNNSGYVSAQVRARVEAAAAELHYVPNSLARSLRSNRTHVLALLLADVGNPFWMTVARGVEDVANQQGFSVILCNTDEKAAKQEEYIDVLLRKRVDGFLLVPTTTVTASVQMIQKQQTPLVILDRNIPALQVDTVRGDTYGGAYRLAEHLLALHHRRIAILTGPAYASTAVERVAGVVDALRTQGFTLAAEQIIFGEFTLDSGYRMAQQLFALASTGVIDEPTAIVTCNNSIAIGLSQYLREAGLRVPHDLSVVTFDDLPVSWGNDPFLTVAVQPAYEMGRCATELLLRRIEAKTAFPPQHVALPVEIMVRHSTAPAVSSE